MGLRSVLSTVVVLFGLLAADLLLTGPVQILERGFELQPASAFAQSADPAFLGAPAAQNSAGGVGSEGQPGFGEVLFKMLPMFVMVFLIFYFMVIKPQQQKLREQDTLIKSLKKGDTVVTTGGMIAKVSQIEPDAIVLELAQNVKVRFEPAHVTKRFEPNKGGKDSASSLKDKDGVKQASDSGAKSKPAA
jgi:preprotein translocase subunit YajC